MFNKVVRTCENYIKAHVHLHTKSLKAFYSKILKSTYSRKIILETVSSKLCIVWTHFYSDSSLRVSKA